MLSCQDIILKFRADVEILCSLCLNTDEDSRIQGLWYDVEAFARLFYTNEKYYIWVF